MLVNDSVYVWEGWEGHRFLGTGRCRIRVYDFSKKTVNGLTYLKPIVVVITDTPESDMKAKSYASQIATWIVKEFSIDPHRMLFVQYYPTKAYGIQGAYIRPEKYQVAEFKWHSEEAKDPKWNPLKTPILSIIKNLVKNGE